MRKALLTVGLLLALTGNALADVPRTINYQGRLTDLNGNPMTDGIYAVTTTLYDSLTGGSSLWSDNYSVQTTNGYFSLILGSNVARPLNLDFTQQYYIGVAVSPDSEMTPRQPLNSVPYALNVAGNGQLIGMRVLTYPTASYVPSSGVRAILVECVGGGGGGGGAAQSSTESGAACGGGGGGYCRKFITSLASSYQVSIANYATGGLAGNNNGQSGNNTTFGNPPILTAYGGGPGMGTSGSSSSYICWTGGGNAGTATGGDINIQGGDGSLGIQIAQDSNISGTGGNAGGGYGFGGKSVYSGGIDGDAGTGYGGGGSGATTVHNGTDRAGGNGTAGVIVIWEYK